jgi:hypothetical protein
MHSGSAPAPDQIDPYHRLFFPCLTASAVGTAEDRHAVVTYVSTLQPTLLPAASPDA